VKGSTYENLVKVMRAQIEKAEGMLTDAEIIDCLGTKPKDTDEQQELERAVKMLTGIKDGKDPTDKSPGRPAYPSEEIDRAIKALGERLAQLVRNKEIEVLHALQNKYQPVPVLNELLAAE
jgi:predicted RNA-binding protein YlxR (DUF448 family)